MMKHQTVPSICSLSLETSTLRFNVKLTYQISEESVGVILSYFHLSKIPSNLYWYKTKYFF